MPTYALYYNIKFLQLKHKNSDIFQPIRKGRKHVGITVL